MRTVYRHGKNNDGFDALPFQHFVYRRRKRIDVRRTNYMVGLQQVEPWFAIFKGQVLIEMDDGFYAIVTPFVTTAVGDSVEVVFPDLNAAHAGISADDVERRIHAFWRVFFQLQHLHYIDEYSLTAVKFF